MHDDALAVVFDFLSSVSEMWARVELVCKQWLRVARATRGSLSLAGRANFACRFLAFCDQ
jgi:hypothetical protein